MQATGLYAFPNPPRGAYELKITANGFATQVFEPAEIKTSLESDVKAALKLGVTTESVNVGRFLGFKFAGGRPAGLVCTDQTGVGAERGL